MGLCILAGPCRITFINFAPKNFTANNDFQNLAALPVTVRKYCGGQFI